MNVVVIAPHPDDEIIGVGGSIAKHVDHGDDVYVLTMTKGGDCFYSDEYVEEGRKQQSVANKILGVKEIRYTDFPSPFMDTILHVDIVKKIQQTLMELKPKVVYIPHYGDMHFEHRVVSEACMVALRPKEFQQIEIYGYEVPSETGWNVPAQHNEFIPNVYVDVTAEFDRKMKALQEFSSQMNEYPCARSIEAIESLAKYRGSTVGVEKAEAFMLIRMQRS